MFSKKNTDCNSMEVMKTKLKAATKVKLCLERKVHNLNNMERACYEELHCIRSEIDLLTEQLEDMKDEISEISYKKATIKINEAAEKYKIDSLVHGLNSHKKEFDTMYAEERQIIDLRNKELLAKEEEEQEFERKRKSEMDKWSELKAREVVAVEMEADAVERECAVLKKRNTAIMLKLRRRLVQTENARRELTNKHRANGNSPA